MKIMVFFLVLFLTGVFAQADSSTVKYGRDICEVVSAKNSTLVACENWVIENSDNNPYSVALNVCEGFNEGLASRASECFTQASKWITDENIKDQTELCEARHGNYVPRSECLKNLFSKKNNEVLKNRSR